MDGWVKKISPPLGLERWTVEPVVCGCSAELFWLHKESSAESSRICRCVTCYISIRQSCMSFRFSHKSFGFYCSFLLIKEVTICSHVFSQTAELFWVVQNSTAADEGNYNCYASNVAGKSSSGTWLTVTGDGRHKVLTAVWWSSSYLCMVKFVIPAYGEVCHTCVWWSLSYLCLVNFVIPVYVLK